MEFTRPVQAGQGVTMKKIKKIKKNVKQLSKMPKGVTYPINVQLQQLIKRMHIPYFYAYYLTNRGSVTRA